MDVSHSVLFVLVLSDVTARCVRMSNRQLLIISVPGLYKLISCISLNSSSFPFFHSLCLGDSVSVRIHPCISSQGSLNDRSDSLSAFVIMWLCLFSVRCKRCTAWAASSVSVSFDVRRLSVESSGLDLWRSFNHNPCTICHGVPHTSQFVDSQASLSACLVQLLPYTTPFSVMKKTAPVRS